MSEEKTGLREARADCGFRGLWIPREIWFDDRLTLLDKVIFARISALDNGEGCYATNKYLAKFCGCVVTRVSMIVSKLIKFGLIEKSNSDTEQRVLRVCVGVLSDTPSPKENTPSPKENTPSLKENPPSLKENPPFSKREPPTSYKNTKEERINDCKRFAPPTLEEVRSYCRERNNRVDAQRFIDYYTSNGWKVGRNPMKDWKAAVRTWERGDSTASRPAITPEQDNRTVYDILREREERRKQNGT